MVQEDISLVGKNKQEIFGNFWKAEGEAKANIVIVHGMAEYSLRYADFASFLASKGYNVYAEDHLGHGKAVSSRKAPEFNYGDWPEDGFQNSVDQVEALVTYVQSQNKLPIFIFGHSLGSFITTAFYEQHSDQVQAGIICGSAYNNMTYRSSRVITSIMKAFMSKKKQHQVNKMLVNLSNNTFNKKSQPFEDGYNSVNNWLSYNEENVKKYDDDKECGFPCTFMFFYGLFKGQQATWKKSALNNIKTPKDILLIAGEDDPVGNYGKDVKNLLKFIKSKQDNVSMKLYPHMKHEILNETDHQKVYDDVVNFFDAELKNM